MVGIWSIESQTVCYGNTLLVLDSGTEKAVSIKAINLDLKKMPVTVMMMSIKSMTCRMKVGVC